MYPSRFFQLFPPFPREDKVFVAMSFHEMFDKRWESVIQPAIRRVGINGTRLEAVRVDQRVISDSILTEILSGVGRCRLVFADVTTMGVLAGRPMRNENVLYEVGLAHAVRLPEEVIIFRSDADPLLFDMANVRVNRYVPDENPHDAQESVMKAIGDALSEIDLARNLAVQRMAESLDLQSWWLLNEANRRGRLQYPVVRTMRDVMAQMHRIPAISRLLDGGLLETSYLVATNDSIRSGDLDGPVESIHSYQITRFGVAVVTACGRKMGLDKLDPDAIAKLTAEFPAE